jgi:hypothetical protein
MRAVRLLQVDKEPRRRTQHEAVGLTQLERSLHGALGSIMLPLDDVGPCQIDPRKNVPWGFANNVLQRSDARFDLRPCRWAGKAITERISDTRAFRNQYRLRQRFHCWRSHRGFDQIHRGFMCCAGFTNYHGD